MARLAWLQKGGSMVRGAEAQTVDATRAGAVLGEILAHVRAPESCSSSGPPAHVNSWSRALASRRSGVSKPSVNQS
jgi:hypothetical protein